MGCTCAYTNQNGKAGYNPFEEGNINTLDNHGSSQSKKH